MGIFRTVGTKIGEHKRRVAGVLAFTGIAVAVFVAGAWAGSSGALTLGPTPAVVSHATHSPATNGHESDGSCCDKPMPRGEMPAGEMGPNMKKHDEMRHGKMGPGKSMGPGKPMHKSDKNAAASHDS
ncbi:hypothetical protein [[Mycobacterium] crassicus]|uniref:Uncharacterized protein n=1 Tax=[Mycobacterium] crassicus TaxID=2872309 RepID=A0ABU5XDF7_9MYCO|nr:hypothetical protein [Mycolicibacter sp. MYC098]MEB3019812.1 hypothetical protein [Mycolicibacter sp. MYC098]